MSEAMDIAILIVAYNSAADLGACLSSLAAAASPPGVRAHVFVVDNASTDDSAAVAERFADVRVIRSASNRGFTGGNNLGWQHIRTALPQVRYLALLNPDAIVDPNWLRPLIEHLEAQPTCAIVQPKIRLHPQRDQLNSAGNRSHFLGFGFTGGFGEVDRGQYDAIADIDFASGSALVIRASLIGETLFDEAMFLYLEDAELSWRMRITGHRVMLVPMSIVYHKHDPYKTARFLEHLERNRWWLLLAYHKRRTLLLLLPALLVTELAVALFALRHGQLSAKMRAWRSLLSRPMRADLRAKRAAVQRARVLTDRAFLQRHTAKLGMPLSSSALVRRIVNPLLAFYWRAARWMLRW